MKSSSDYYYYDVIHSSISNGAIKFSLNYIQHVEVKKYNFDRHLMKKNHQLLSEMKRKLMLETDFMIAHASLLESIFFPSYQSRQNLPENLCT